MNAPQFSPAKIYLPRHYIVEQASAETLPDAMKLRQAVFCDEQGIFEHTDRDKADESAITLVARPRLDAQDNWGPVVGTVRIDQLSPRVWQGSRLAVAMEYRRLGVLGGALIQLAVRTANTLGCDQFIANVQAANAPLFRRLHWVEQESVLLHGCLHQRMEADLSHYPPFNSDMPMSIEIRRGEK